MRCSPSGNRNDGGQTFGDGCDGETNGDEKDFEEIFPTNHLDRENGRTMNKQAKTSNRPSSSGGVPMAWVLVRRDDEPAIRPSSVLDPVPTTTRRSFASRHHPFEYTRLRRSASRASLAQLGVLSGGGRFPRRDRSNLEVEGSQQPAIGRDEVSRVEIDDIPGDKIARGNYVKFALTQGARHRRRQFTQRGERGFRSFLLKKAEDAVEEDDGEDRECVEPFPDDACENARDEEVDDEVEVARLPACSWNRRSMRQLVGSELVPTL
ncbi:MAG: hypothetical protein U1D30_20160 [Planctomycetota bacterium]